MRGSYLFPRPNSPSRSLVLHDQTRIVDMGQTLSRKKRDSDTDSTLSESDSDTSGTSSSDSESGNQSSAHSVNIRSECGHFRVLVIGKANAGKTTLLKKVCNSIEDPEIFNPSGELINRETVEGTHLRGEHDIENELMFKSNPGYIFHDSRGFESGSASEVERVKAFISDRSWTGDLPKQIHAIWYCLPADTTRSLTKADDDFFNTDMRGRVPLIAIFTKLDGLENEAFTQLRNEGYSNNDSEKLLSQRTQQLLTTNFRQPLEQTSFPPSAYVELDDMRETGSNCNELIEKTASTLTDTTLRSLFESAQRSNIMYCTMFAIGFGLVQKTTVGIVSWTLGCYSHLWVRLEEVPTAE
ncbi:hypothetical protein C8J57DRAFT_390841 [Mycena rebaudengoi]|nr:hypothetical protein C8J57DRAFT_390841 [Mycena rebaudengoi]